MFAVTAIILVLAVIAGIYGSDLSPAARQRWANFTSGMDIVVISLTGAVLLIYSLVNVRSALHFFRGKQLGLGGLWLSLAGVQFLCAIVALGWIME